MSSSQAEMLSAATACIDYTPAHNSVNVVTGGLTGVKSYIKTYPVKANVKAVVENQGGVAIVRPINGTTSSNLGNNNPIPLSVQRAIDKLVNVPRYEIDAFLKKHPP